MGETFQYKNRITVRIRARLKKGTGKFKNVITVSEQLRINRFNTATVVLDMFKEIFGYDKYSEIISDFDIKTATCLLAIKNGKAFSFLIEVYPVTFDLESFQNIELTGYGKYQDVDKLIVTNGIYWIVFKINMNKAPVELARFNFLKLVPGKPEDVELLYGLCKEYPK